MNTLAPHLFISDCDGALHDRRRPDWARHPLRVDYRRTHRNIETPAQLRATLRAGAYAWPGGYPLFLLLSDGECLCFKCARREYRQVSRAIREHSRDGWRVVGCDINYNDLHMFCARCGEHMESAYGKSG